MLLREIDNDEYAKIGRLFTSKRGKEVLDILSKRFYNTVSFTPGCPDVMAFKEGQRDIVQICRTAANAAERANQQETNNA